MDVTGQNLVCGTDGEAVYIVENLDLGVWQIFFKLIVLGV
jgi:hypothetical protein